MCVVLVHPLPFVNYIVHIWGLDTYSAYSSDGFFAVRAQGVGVQAVQVSRVQGFPGCMDVQGSGGCLGVSRVQGFPLYYTHM